MNRKAFLMMIAVTLCFNTAYASEAGDSWWAGMKIKLQGLTSGRKTVTTAVGGVRGEKIKSYGDLYWKGREEEVLIVPKEELGKFQAALDLAEEGKTEDSLKAFEEFVSLYPRSSLSKDAMDAIERLKVDLFKPEPEPEELVEMPAEQQSLETQDAMIEEVEPEVPVEQAPEPLSVEPEAMEMEVAPEVVEEQEPDFQPEDEVAAEPNALGKPESGTEDAEPQEGEEEIMDDEGGDLWSIP